MRKQGAPIKHLARGIPGLLVKASHPVFARRLEAAARAFAEGGATGEHFTDLSDACMAVMIALELKGRKKLPAPVEAGAECLRTIHRRHEAGGAMEASPDESNVLEAMVGTVVDYWSRQTTVLWEQANQQLAKIRIKQLEDLKMDAMNTPEQLAHNDAHRALLDAKDALSISDVMGKMGLKGQAGRKAVTTQLRALNDLGLLEPPETRRGGVAHYRLATAHGAPGPTPGAQAASPAQGGPASPALAQGAPATGPALAQGAPADVFDVGTPAGPALLGEFTEQAREALSWSICARAVIGVEDPTHALEGLVAMAARGEYLLSELTQAHADLAALSAELVALRNDNAAWSSLSRFITPVNPETAAWALETQQEELERLKAAAGHAVGYAVLQKGRDPVFHMGPQGRGRAKAGALRASRGAEDNGQMPRVFALVPVGRVTRAVVWVEGMTA